MSEPSRVPADQPLPENRYVNRELSWLAFNERVLQEATNVSTPLLERLRFLTIFYTNLDEFFMVRVSGIKQQVQADVEVLSIDGLSPRMQLIQIHERVARLVGAAQRVLAEEILPGLSALGVQVVHYHDLSPTERSQMDAWFTRRVSPILIPLAVGPTHPFPFISNLSLNIALMVQSPDGEERLARVKVPLANLPRLVPIGDDDVEPPMRLLPIEELIAANLGALYPGMRLTQAYLFCVTRDADLEIKEDEADDLVSTLQQELRKRRFGQAVRLEVEAKMPDDIRELLRQGLGLTPTDVVAAEGLLAVPRLTQLLKIDLPDAKFRPYVPRRPATLQGDVDLFTMVRQHDVLLHHPFDSFAPVVDLIRAAARDDRVVAIKQTLYRTSGDSPIIRALEDAVEGGKQVAAVVELKARFDEENNIVWARRLEEAGVHVIYGVPGLKTHSKITLIIRHEGEDLVRYAHIGTGNYNPTTARIYTDLGLLTCNPEITADVADLFNRLTGFARPTGYRKLMVAPTHMKNLLLARIEHEGDHAQAGREAHLIAKCNAVTDHQIIDALYDASRKGVRIDLLVRGICCLVPGVPGMSETISVRSVVGRFLEHNRIYWFNNGGSPQVFMGSADWMERNLERRVEVLSPIEDPTLARWIREVLLQRYLDDACRTHTMRPDAGYDPPQPGPDAPDVHAQFMADAR